MKYETTLNKILSKMSAQIPIVENGDLIETFSTMFPNYKDVSRINGLDMTIPYACSKEWKKLYLKEGSYICKIYKDMDRGDILLVNKIENNKIFVENISLDKKYRKEFTIDKIDIIKKNFNVIKRKSVDLLESLDKLK